MAGRRRAACAGSPALPALGIGLLLLLVLPTAAEAASAGVTVSSSGVVVVGLIASIPNGSIVREAMDGNFSPIVSAITSNTTEQANILAEISTAESTPVISSLFGNRDGFVEPGEVTSFESLLSYEAQLLPTGGISGGALLSFTLDGAAATSTKITGITFSNATGPADSTAPVGVSTQITYAFPYGGSTHTLSLSTDVPTTPFPLALLTGSVGLSVTTPAGTSVTGTSGFSQAAISNDPLGWGTSSVSGSFTPTTTGPLSVSFDTAFPTGDLLIVAPIVAAAAIASVLLYRRRARRRATPPS
jgi:hypothetical protein